MRKIIVALLLFLIANSLSATQICMIIAQDGFRDEELFVPKEIFQVNGIKVVIASSSINTCKGMLGGMVEPDIKLADINVDDYSAILFVGGIGAKQYWNDPLAHRIIQSAYKKGKIIGAICIAPVILANAGILKDKKATVWPSEKGRLIKQGAIYTGAGVEQDGNIITADSPGSAEGFGLRVLEAIKALKK